ncbi:MAG: fumarylacetoacetate hydrolase family protein [Acidimicrobiia bacterium]
MPRAGVDLLSPITPGKVICVGLNYADHAKEQGLETPRQPVIFAKFPSAVVGPESPILKPAEVQQLDYEAELGVVIGREAKRVSEGNAMEFVAGYVAINDISARDFQFEDGQWVRGKSLDTFCPTGPALVTTDEISDVHDLAIQCWVNGERRQTSSTANLIFGVSELIEFCSRFFTLHPGDVIATGTPGGVGMFLHPPQFLNEGDVIEVEVEKVGRLRNVVVSM